tara:strand:- start:1682 stop:3403 length:1722 start_codon:yes stop_codon:yes gene_type:complete
LECKLYTADILHSTFEGLGVRSAASDQRIEYDALSYTWGNKETPRSILCNGVEFPIGDNLFEAFRELRYPDCRERYLWVDAICIDQANDDEVSQQVSNMFVIYQKAARVIAWIGPADKFCEEVGYVLYAAGYPIPKLASSLVNFWKAHDGLTYIYNRPWFTRIWIQQEVFAARKLRLMYGGYVFKWRGLLTQPGRLSTSPHEDLRAQLDAISRLEHLHASRLACFENFAKRTGEQDFIETLLSTSKLGATDPRDYIYGVLGITGFPAKAMSLEDWRLARKDSMFLPIDYSADLGSVLATVTWVLLMMGGLGVLAKFKVFGLSSRFTCDQPLASWVIDWRIASRLFVASNESDAWGLKLEDAATRTFEEAVAQIPQYKRGKCGEIRGSPAPSVQEQLQKDNKDCAIPCTRLILRGMVDSRYYVTNNCVWERRRFLKDKKMWKLEFDVEQEDVVAFLVGFDNIAHGGGFREWYHRVGGLWLLRPVKNMPEEAFIILAFLSWNKEDDQPFYGHWIAAPDTIRDLSTSSIAGSQESYEPLRRLAIQQREPYSPGTGSAWIPPLADEELIGARKFLIV